MVKTEEMQQGALAGLGALVGRLSRAEYLVALVIFAALLALFTGYKMIRIDQFRGDSAMYFQGTENAAQGRALASQVQASIVDYLNLNKYQNVTPDELAADPGRLFGRPAQARERSLLLGHAYFVLYPVAQLVRFIPVRAVLLFLHALSFCGLLALAYFLLRRSGVSVAGAAIFCLLIVAQPAWWEGLLWGQFYPDRLFILLGVLLMALAAVPVVPAARNSNRLWLFLAALACASINERGAIVSGIFLLLYALVYWKKPGIDRYYKIGLGVVLLGYGLVAVKLLLPTDSSYQSFLPTNFAGLNALIHMPAFLPMVKLFLLINAPLLLLALFEWRAAVIAAVLMLPNIFGNIGGAEKLGWATHYPSFFFAPLVWAGLSGYIVLAQKASTAKRLPTVYAAACVLILFLSMLNPFAYAPISVSFGNIGGSCIPTIASQTQTYLFKPDARRRLADAAIGIQQAIPPNSLVSSVEAGMPLLYQGRTIEFFPSDIDNADYAVLGAAMINGKMTYSGTVSFQTPDDRKRIDDMVLARMKHDGYDLDHPQIFMPLASLAVFRRVH